MIWFNPTAFQSTICLKISRVHSRKLKGKYKITEPDQGEILIITLNSLCAMVGHIGLKQNSN